MIIKLLDYAGTAHEVKIGNAIDHISGVIISGDTVMEYPFHYDTGIATRMMDFYDGSFIIPASKFAQMNEITDSYQLFDLSE